MTLQHVDIVFQLIVFLFAISIHESAHAWMANRCGDPTAKMLGRITLNPIKHIDPVGTILLPIIAMFAHFSQPGIRRYPDFDRRSDQQLSRGFLCRGPPGSHLPDLAHRARDGTEH
jgi:hypothetical protein